MIKTPTALHVEGRYLKDSAGKTVKLAGIDAFAAFARHVKLNGGNGFGPFVQPVLQQHRAVMDEAGYDGYAVLRVFRYAANGNVFAVDPWSYTQAQITDFTLRCKLEGFYVDWTAGDAQQCFTGVDGPQGLNEHQNRFTSALVGCDNCIWNTSNEPWKNGVDVSKVTPPPWAPVIQYSGDYGDKRDTSKDLACINYHTPRDTEDGAPKWVTKGYESAPYLWKHGKPIFYDEDMGFDEVQSGSRSTSPEYAGILGAQLSIVSAVYFHCTDGMRGDSLRPIQRQCAVQFFKGAQGTRTL